MIPVNNVITKQNETQYLQSDLSEGLQLKGLGGGGKERQKRVTNVRKRG